jgi:hypothetical protein
MAMTYAEAKEAFMGIGFHATTYKYADDITAATDEGKLLAVTGIGEVGTGDDAGVPVGILKKFESDGYCSVQDGGYAEIDIEHNATAANEVTNGSWVETDGAGKGALAAAATGVRAVAVDATNHKAIVKIG